MHPFRAAVEARDTAAIEELLDDVVFTSPAALEPVRMGAEFPRIAAEAAGDSRP